MMLGREEGALRRVGAHHLERVGGEHARPQRRPVGEAQQEEAGLERRERRERKELDVARRQLDAAIERWTEATERAASFGIDSDQLRLARHVRDQHWRRAAELRPRGHRIHT